MTGTAPTSRLARLVAGLGSRPVRLAETDTRWRGGKDDHQYCELCAEPIEPGHQHLLDLSARQLCCVCRACAVLFDRSEAGGRHYRLVPQRRRRLTDLVLGDETWASLRIPVGLAFFFHDSAAGRVVGFYPSPAGAVESLVELSAWSRIEQDNPVLREMEPDVEALLVHRARGAREHWLVPVDDCYALVGLVRTHWTGFTGGPELWAAVDRFFAELERSTTCDAGGER
ncbi:MAG TPA: DUF5947 family protein [Pseudonocardiaceae bacterium]